MPQDNLNDRRLNEYCRPLARERPRRETRDRARVSFVIVQSNLRTVMTGTDPYSFKRTFRVALFWTYKSMSRDARQGIRADPLRIVGFISGEYRGMECLSCGARRLGVLHLQCVTAARARTGCRLPAAAVALGRTAKPGALSQFRSASPASPAVPPV